jgi:ribonuclease Z
MTFSVTILGSGSAAPSVNRHHTAHALNVHEQFFLIDCGEGTQERLRCYGIPPMRLNAVFISHLHGDHVFGLPGLISSLNHLGRKTPLHLFGPAPIGEILSFHLKHFESNSGFEILLHELNARREEAIFETKTLEVGTIPLRHRIPACGYLFRERPTGRVPYAPRTYAYCSDTLPSGRVARRVAGVDLLYHEATFLDKDRHLARATGHSTALQAAKIAATAGVGQLLIGHFSSRYKDERVLVEEARSVFPGTVLAREGETVSLSRRLL